MRGRERRLLAALRADPEAAREHVLEHVYPRLYSYLCYLCGDAERAADLAQETAVRVWRGWPQLEARTAPSVLAWAHTIARNVFLDFRRAAREASPLDEEWPAGEKDPAEEALAQLDAQAAVAAVGRLPDIYRQAILLRFFQGLAYREVAAVLGIPRGTVRSRLAKGLELLRRELVEKENRGEV